MTTPDTTHGPDWQAFEQYGSLAPVDPVEASLEAYREQGQQGEITPAGLVLTNEHDADWALRKVAEYQQGQEKAQKIYERELHMLNGWHEQMKRYCEDKIAFFTRALASFHRLHPPLGNRKSTLLAHGTIGTKSQQPKTARDDEKLVKWLKENSLHDMVKTTITVEVIGDASALANTLSSILVTDNLNAVMAVKEAPRWKELKECLDLTGSEAIFTRQQPFDPSGEVVEAVTVEHVPEAFYVKPILPQMIEGKVVEISAIEEQE